VAYWNKNVVLKGFMVILTLHISSLKQKEPQTEL